ncbi:hypothetical protein [Morganella morganii IS15]|nr:hypothetical protein CSB69_2481 [Morganella morganii]EMP50631.1 hypothetical protein C790_02511 [Morganella morganii SC01]CDK65880.1 hypothetical protein [Morganella morganii IS15]
MIYPHTNLCGYFLFPGRLTAAGFFPRQRGFLYRRTSHRAVRTKYTAVSRKRLWCDTV